MNVSFSKTGIIWCILMIIGCVLVGKGFLAQCRYYGALDFDELTSADWKYGDYVSDNITSIVKNKVSNKSYRACSGEFDGYYEYTIPVGDNRYVRLRVGNYETYTLLEEACEQESFSIPFAGVISESSSSINNTFYESAGGIEPEQVITEFVIKQIEPSKVDHSLIYGFFLLLTCLAIRLTGILPPIVTVEEAIAIPARTRYSNSCDCETEIEVQKHTVARLEARMEKLYKEYRQSLMILPLAGLFLLLSIVFLIISFLPNLLAAPLIMIFFLLGLFILIIALVGIFDYYIQTEGKLGLFLRTFKNITPIPKLIEICKDNIKYLEERLAYEQTLTPIYSDKLYSELNLNQHIHVTNEDWKDVFPPNEDEYMLLPEEETDDVTE